MSSISKRQARRHVQFSHAAKYDGCSEGGSGPGGGVHFIPEGLPTWVLGGILET